LLKVFFEPHVRIHEALEPVHSTALFLRRERQHALELLKIYLVEDSAVIRASLIATLEELAPVQIVSTAEDEQHAVQWMLDPSHHFDLVIVDIQLRSGSGLGVITAANGLLQRHKLVVLTNYATPDMRRKCLGLGADRVFDKSHDLDALLAYCKALAAGEASDHSALLPA
jgi:DNA-binding NarL/FixJ family response regulator